VLESLRPVDQVKSSGNENKAWPHQSMKPIMATEDEVRWIDLWKNRPPPSASREAHQQWFRQIERHSGLSLNTLDFHKLPSNILPPEITSSDAIQSSKKGVTPKDDFDPLNKAPIPQSTPPKEISIAKDSFDLGQQSFHFHASAFFKRNPSKPTSLL